MAHFTIVCLTYGDPRCICPGFRTNEEDPVGRLVEAYMGVLLFVRETRETGALCLEWFSSLTQCTKTLS